MALHCDRAKLALDTVLKKFEQFGWQRPATSVFRMWGSAAAPWKILEVHGATLYSPSGQSFTEEPAAIREEYEKVPMTPPKKESKRLAPVKEELPKGNASTVLERQEFAKGNASTVVDRPGTYEILAKLEVRAELSLVSAPVANHLVPGALVTVLEVATLKSGLPVIQRTRARIEKPEGWITLLNRKSGKRFAQRQEDPQHIIDLDGVKIPSLECDIDEGVARSSDRTSLPSLGRVSDEGVTRSPNRTSLATQGRLTSKRVRFGDASASVDLESGLCLVSDVQPTTYGAVGDLKNALGPFTEVERAEDFRLGRVNCTMVPQPLQQESSTEEPTGWAPAAMVSL